MKRIFLLLFTYYLPLTTYYSYGQGVALGKWRDYLSYNVGVSIAIADNKVYCATPYCIFYFNKDDNSMNRLSNINGLSDFGISTIKYSSKFKVLLVAYTNSNIDIIDNNSDIINFSDLKRKQILGNKTINRITFLGDYAYLSCSFGIVVFNLAKKEIEDTYNMGPNGNAINVLDVAIDDKNIYAATEKGIYTAPLSGANLAYFNSWTKMKMPYPDKKYNCIIYFNNKIFANQSNKKDFTDSLYVYDKSSWNKFEPECPTFIHSLDVSNGKLIISAENYVDIIDTDEKVSNHIWNYNPANANPSQALLDNDNILWVADKRLGLVKYHLDGNFESMIPDGPATNSVWSMACEEGKLWVATGGLAPNWDNAWGTNTDNLGTYTYNTNSDSWFSFTPNNTKALVPVSGYISTAIDPLNTNLAYIGTWNRGLMMFQNDQYYKTYNETNSSLRPFVYGNYKPLRVGGIHFDKDNYMWITNPGADKPISVKAPGENGEWKSFAAPGITNDMFLSDFAIDDIGQKWIIIPRGKGILVFNDNNTISYTADDQFKKLSNSPGLGNLPSLSVYSIANDLQGEIWVGTDQGVAVFYSPGSVFSGSDFDAQQILVNQNGHWENLLQTETVTAIAVDGANRKWFGTQNAGVYLMSADGTQQIEHFNKDNSPLFSNTITSIVINHQNGEVFFGTNIGIISYRGTATKGADNYSDKNSVYAYPNPVRENYEGNVAIKGLVTDSDVKITSINGNLVYSTKAFGGQAIWNMRNFDGTKVYSGVYLVLCSNDDGTETIATKILVIK